MEPGRLNEAGALLAQEKANGFQCDEAFFVPAYFDLRASVASALGDRDAAEPIYAKLARWPNLVVFTVRTVHGAVAHDLPTLAALLGRDDLA